MKLLREIGEAIEMPSAPGHHCPRTWFGWCAAYWNLRFLFSFKWYWHGVSFSNQPDRLRICG